MHQRHKFCQLSSNKHLAQVFIALNGQKTQLKIPGNYYPKTVGSVPHTSDYVGLVVVQRLQLGVLFVVSDPGRPPPHHITQDTQGQSRQTEHRSKAF